MIRSTFIISLLSLAALSAASSQGPEVLPQQRSRACIEGPKKWEITVDVDGDLSEENVEIFQTGFHAPFLARWVSIEDGTRRSETWAVANRLIVRLSPEFGLPAARTILASLLSSPDIEIKPIPLPNTFLVEAPWSPEEPISSPLLLVKSQALRGDSRIEHYSPDYLYFSISTTEPTDDLYQQRQDDLKRMGAVAAWKVSKGAGTSVAVLDTGVDCKHTDLKCDLGAGSNILNSAALPFDDNDHGTYCAGIIGAKLDGWGIVGVAPETSIIPVKVLDKGGCGTASDVINGIEFAIGSKVDIISASFGGFPGSKDLKDKIKEAGDNGIIFVAGSGNATRNLDCPDQAFFPAGYDLPNIISVGAATDKDGPRLDWGHGRLRVHISAPGETVHSTVRTSQVSYDNDDGTSAATAFVAGACALVKASMKAAGMTPTVKDVKDRILQTSTDRKGKLAGTGVSCSEGRLDLANALSESSILRTVCPLPGARPRPVCPSLGPTPQEP